jgi:hypothetical protein
MPKSKIRILLLIYGICGTLLLLFPLIFPSSHQIWAGILIFEPETLWLSALIAGIIGVIFILIYIILVILDKRKETKG